MPSPIANALQAPDPRIVDLIQASEVRVGMHSFMYTTDPRTGELNGALSARQTFVLCRHSGFTFAITAPTRARPPTVGVRQVAHCPLAQLPNFSKRASMRL